MFQPSLADLGAPLSGVTFVVVDLETTGGSPRDCGITEIGAVKVRGGELLGELATLVDPRAPIPAAVSALTGITSTLVSERPTVDAVLPAFLEFAHGSALVAHNARFDTAFLNAALERLHYPRLTHPVVCTAALARRLLGDELRSMRLALLARHLHARTTPTHRALADARATVEVFHTLLERAGSFGVTTLDDLLDFARMRNAPVFAARRTLADHLPSAPGVYRFLGRRGEVLYVGKATDLRARVRSYFGTDTRRRIVDLVRETVCVDHTVTATSLEAAVLECRALQDHRPRYNRRGGRPAKGVWVTLTDEAYPRLSLTRTQRPKALATLGPFGSRRTAAAVVDALHAALPLRRCSDRMSAATRFPPCALAELGRCLAPCAGRVDVETYRASAERAVRTLHGDPAPVAAPLLARMAALAARGRYEEAGEVRDRLAALITALRADRRVTWVRRVFVVASRPAGDGWCEAVVADHGHLVGSVRCPPEELAGAVAELRRRGAVGAAAGRAEALLLAEWLERPGVRVELVEGLAAEPVDGGRMLADLAQRLRDAGRPTGRPGSELADKRTRR